MPQISVVVPVYKTKLYLEKCINSILSQSFTDFEMILVDDGSPDYSGELCDTLSKKDERIKVVHKENGGLTSARIAGLEKANGEYIAFVDSDDYLHEDYLLNLFNAIKQQNAELAICGYYVVKGESQTPVYLPYKKNSLNKSEIDDKYILPLIGRIYDGKHLNLPGFMCVRMFKKSCMALEMFVSEREFFTEDDVFNILYAEKVNNIAIINEPLYYYVQHDQSLTNCYRKGKLQMLQNRYNFCEKWLMEKDLYQKGEKRLIAAAVSAVNACIDNAVLLNDYRLFKNEINEIKNSKLYNKGFLSVNPNSLAASQKLNYYLLKFNLKGLLYIYRKARVKA